MSDGTNGWTKTHTKTTETNDPADAFSNSVRGNNTVGYASEAYAGWGSLIQTAYSMKQTITLPAGNYRLVNYSFFRQGGAYNTNSSKSLAKLVAGTNEVALKTLGSITAAGYANSQAEGANCFDSKMYRNVVEFTIAADNTEIEIGIEGTFDEAKSWCIVGQFELFDLNDLASVSSPTDVTYTITNPGFEYRDLSGWTTTKSSDDKAFWYMDNTALANKAGIGWVESYQGGGIPDGRAIYQDLTGLDNGLYEVTVYGHLQQGSGSDGFYLYANSDKVAIGSTDQDYSVRTTVTDGNLRIKLATDACNGNWAAFDKVRMKFYGDPLPAYQALLDVAVNDAQTYINSTPALSTEQIAALQAIINANDNDDNAFTQESQFNTAIETINTAVDTYKAMVAPYAAFNALKTSANAIAAVAYNETTSGSHTTFAGAITAQTTAADNATSATAITTAATTLTAAIKTYIAGAEPQNDGEYFDLTCLMVNPNFEDSHNGWTYVDAPGVNWSNCEYYEKEFDINQTVTGLPTGSYSLSVQAFQRPGWASDVWTAYNGGTDGASSVLYINSITSNVKNIMADAQNAPKLDKVDDKKYGDWPYDSQVGGDKYIPNSQQGAKLYFDAGFYDATCAAVVTNEDGGSLKLGFKSTKNHVSGDWTIFDNFRLYYYGSSLLVYYKQYLPQLKAEASADLSNALYDNITGAERTEFQTALAATPASETEEAYKNVIDAIVTKQTAFRDAVTAYDGIVAAKAAATVTKITANVGTGIFQYNESTNNSLYSAYETAKVAVDGYTVNNESTATAINTILTPYNTAVSNYNNQALNAPATDKRYTLTIVEDGKDWNGNAITFIAGGREDAGHYAIKYLAPANANLNQALKFTAVDGETNTYKVSAVNAETGAEQYITTGSTYDGNNTQIRTTDDASKASWVKIKATETANQFQLLNVSDGNKVIANNNNNDMYTANAADFTIAEASQATVNITIDAAVKYATRIFPFTPALPTGVKAYSCAAVDNGTLTLAVAATPEANKPYILEAESGYTGDALTGWGVAGATTATEGLLTGVYAEQKAIKDTYVMQKQGDVVAFYKVAEGSEPIIGANRCYLTAPAAGARDAFYFNEATAIKAIETLTSGNAEIFDANGVRLPALKKGMNILKKADGTTYKIMVK